LFLKPFASGGKGEEEAEKSKEIDASLKEDARALMTTIKILLLGPGQTGKTTFMKQIQFLYANGFDAEKLKYFRKIILGNILDFADAMVAEMETKEIYKEEVDFIKPYLTEAKRDDDDLIPKELGEALYKFWKKPAVQSFFNESPNYLENDSCKYYFDKLKEITKPGYQPTTEDVFRCRVKSTGIYELKFQITDGSKRKFTYLLTDVGGQRSERNKWIHSFEGVMAVIFFVDLSGFNLMLDEAPTFNRLDESLKLFEAIANSQWFKNSTVILFFNKTDLFKEKLENVKFADYVPGYYGDNTFESTSAFLKQKFLSLNKQYASKPVYAHFTCATDTKNMKFVFNTVSEVIIRNSLKASGLI